MKITAFVFLFFLNLFAQAQEKDERIFWTEDRPLTWADFRAEPEADHDFSANTNSGISLGWNYSTASGKPVFEYEVKAYFDPNRSWVQDDIDESDELLAHEQAHFDISEIHARKFRKALSEYEIGRNIRQDMKRLTNKFEADRKAMQQAFDRETNHSENAGAEKRWLQFIKAELDSLEKFKS
ncbi:DUF922 domain-containing Zn-dependent protease [Gramella sp. GC03-9]|uniref:DUF922 domain-containing Zn-dependent protease n=1 Tax=Christiangramia oceanisediminis TaxID=2920386 RepID=A0A9X2KZ41_9FLAO|nr:DUF922 domain-containing protein [Gramella oceanisediminis]MCP9201028.1 DUF922 domain-containing Zn-dependent protease [Gramella oceanisediminis]